MTKRNTVSGSRPDPVAGMSFKVSTKDAQIGYFAECSGITAEYEIEEYAEGGENAFVHKLRGRMRYPNLSLKRGVTHETALLDWFFKSQEAASGRPLRSPCSAPTASRDPPWGSRARSRSWEGPSLNAGSTRSPPRASRSPTAGSW